ncbi:MAG: 30S ribosomal protein S2, partial [Alphaproteobacteria bacterium]|nr:30S ribosomal protein S2 [Alphaproteobacteria bacterium]
LTRERDKLDRALGGIKDMGGLPDMLFVIDTVKEQIALKEAIKLGIPVVAVVDSNADPEEVTYPVPGNDDAARAIELYLDLVSRAVLAGLQREQQESGVDIGASADLVGQIPAAPAPEEAPAEAAAEATEAAPEAAAEPEAPAEPEAAAEAEPVPEAAAEPTTEAEPADETKPAAGE